MLFNSYTFIFGFLPIAIFVYFGLCTFNSKTAAKAWLVALSLIFYGWWNPAFLGLLLASIAVNFLISIYIRKYDDRPRPQIALLWAGVCINLGALFYYKYLFAIISFLLSIGVVAQTIDPIILPLGISFFTFTQIGYLVDCQQGLADKEGNFLDYALFVTFFPHLIAGPIIHHREMMPQYANPDTFRFNIGHISAGLTLFVIGLFKKVVFADSLAPWVDSGFANPDRLQVLTGVMTVLGYSMQLYFDFSGYSDMAVGLAALFNIRFPINFNSPYKARNIMIFWQTWHMTLTRYLTLLVYNPVSLWASRRRIDAGLSVGKAALRTPAGFLSMLVLPTFVTMFLSGIWHGAGLQFLIFGLLHAAYLVIAHGWNVMTTSRGTRGRAKENAATAAGSVLLTYLAVLLGQIFFRATSVHAAVSVLAAAGGWHGWDLPLGFKLSTLRSIPYHDLWISVGLFHESSVEIGETISKPLLQNGAIIFALCALVWAAPNSYQIMGSYSPALQRVANPATKWLAWAPNVIWAVLTAAAFAFVYTRLGSPTRFLYFQF